MPRIALLLLVLTACRGSDAQGFAPPEEVVTLSIPFRPAGFQSLAGPIGTRFEGYVVPLPVLAIGSKIVGARVYVQTDGLYSIVAATLAYSYVTVGELPSGSLTDLATSTASGASRSVIQQLTLGPISETIVARRWYYLYTHLIAPGSDGNAVFGVELDYVAPL